ncbi:outer membrane lipoprotein carrier protein LolA [Desulfovibrio sp. OttesenSCG-928-C06]|nr:outer membrane lipoprotein carrier protein LolA [Desulfovibrio sp. OttesenSCG-928-C06]
MISRFRAVSVFVALALFLLQAQNPALCPAAGLAAEEQSVLERIVDGNRNIESIESRFTQTRYTFFLDEELVSDGFFVFRAPDQLVWQYDSPAFFRLEYKDGKASFRNNFDGDDAPAAQNPREAELAAQIGRQIMLWISFDLESIRTSYSLEFKQLSPPVLLLSPKKKSPSPINEIELFFAPNGLDVTRVVLHESDGDYIRLDFADARRVERQD